jgi:hypothetical protein
VKRGVLPERFLSAAFAAVWLPQVIIELISLDQTK